MSINRFHSFIIRTNKATTKCDNVQVVENNWMISKASVLMSVKVSTAKLMKNITVLQMKTTSEDVKEMVNKKKDEFEGGRRESLASAHQA